MSRVISDAKYVWLNCFVNKIPCYSIRKKLYQLAGMKIEQGARIGIGTVIVCPEKICLKARSVVNEFCHLDGRGGLMIGNDTAISIYSTIITASHDKDDNSFRYYEKKTRIGRNVWVGAHAIILDGTTIEDQAVIGAGCVVKGHIMKGQVIVGNSERKTKERKTSQYYQLDYRPFFR